MRVEIACYGCVLDGRVNCVARWPFRRIELRMIQATGGEWERIASRSRVGGPRRGPPDGCHQGRSETPTGTSVCGATDASARRLAGRGRLSQASSSHLCEILWHTRQLDVEAMQVLRWRDSGCVARVDDSPIPVDKERRIFFAPGRRGIQRRRGAVVCREFRQSDVLEERGSLRGVSARRDRGTSQTHGVLDHLFRLLPRPASARFAHVGGGAPCRW
mmetsp:Transcript_23382/g.71625  ORF Transcript_23382/g.71625 Transcript_23382/m.71625 type:complete len:217 (+) Transcript_23382:1105-1755(+)